MRAIVISIVLAQASLAAPFAHSQNYNPRGGYSPNQKRYGDFERQQYENDMEQQRQRQEAIRQQLEQEGYGQNHVIGPQQDDQE